MIGAATLLATPSLFAQTFQYQQYDVNPGNITLIDNTGLYSYGNGGEFRAAGDARLTSIVNQSAYSQYTLGQLNDANNVGWGSQSGYAQNGALYFQTFCTEYNEEFTPGNPYNVSYVGNAALYDARGSGNPVPITIGVAYLYSLFASGNLAGYDYAYGSGRSVSAGELQSAIWDLLGENVGYLDTSSSTSGNNNYWIYQILVDKFGSQSAWDAAANGAYGVADMVLSSPGAAQDQLVIINNGQPQAVPVPEASTVFAGALMLLPLGASALRIVRKNRQA